MARRAAPPRASVLIIAGGRGTRFWPASREANPKPLFSIDGKTSLLADTIARHVPLIPRERIFVLAAAAHQAPFRRALRGLIPAQQPDRRADSARHRGRNRVRRRDHQAPARRRSNRVGRRRPSHRDRRSISPHARRCDRSRRVARFDSRDRDSTDAPRDRLRLSEDRSQRSAPDFESRSSSRSRRSRSRAGWCVSGRYLWNASMFVASTQTLAREFATHSPAARHRR